MLKVQKVYRYSVTGKLVAANEQGNRVLPLNSDLSFSGKDAHSVRRATTLELTPASWPHAEEAILASLFDFSGAAKKFVKEHNITLFSVARDYLGSDYRPGT